MNKAEEKAILTAWKDWHKGLRPDEIPKIPNLSFERGFLAGVEYANQSQCTKQSIDQHQRESAACAG